MINQYKLSFLTPTPIPLEVSNIYLGLITISR